MNIQTYTKLLSIIDELDPKNIEQVKNFASDCMKSGSPLATKYIDSQIKFECEIDLPILRFCLNEDFSSC